MPELENINDVWNVVTIQGKPTEIVNPIKLNDLDSNNEYEYKAYMLIDGEYKYGKTFTGTTGSDFVSGLYAEISGETSTSTGITVNVRVYKFGGKYSVDNYGVIYKIGDNSNLEIGKPGVNKVPCQISEIDKDYQFEDNPTIGDLQSNTMIYCRAYVQYVNDVEQTYFYSQNIIGILTKQALEIE